MIVVMLIALYTTRALLESLGIEGYGIYNVVCGFVSMFTFLNTSMANGVQRFFNFEIGKNGDKHLSKVFTHSMVIQLAISIIIILLIESVGLWYLYNKMNIPQEQLTASFWIFQFSMIQLVINMMTVPYSAIVMSYEKMNFYAYISIFDAMLKLIFVIILPFIPYDSLITYGLLMLAITIIDFFLYWLYCRCYFQTIKYEAVFDKILFKSILSFSGWNVFGTLAGIANGQGLNLIYNYFWSTLVNAANGISGQVSAAVNSLMLSFVTAVRPQMIKSYATGDLNQLKKMYYTASKMTFLLMSVLALPLIGEISIILDFWLGKDNYPGITTIFCQLTIVLLLANSFAIPSSIVVHATGNMKKFQIIVSLVSSAILPLAFIVGYSNCDAYLVIMINIVVAILTQLTRVILIKRLVGFGLRDYMRVVLIPCISSTIPIVAVILYLTTLTPSNILWAILKCCLVFFVSCISFYVIGLNVRERQLLISYTNNFKLRVYKTSK